MTVRQEPELPGLSSVWRWLAHPIAAIQDATARQDVQLLLMLLVFLIPLMAVATLAAAIMLGYGYWREAFFYIPIAVMVGFILAFLLGRRGWCKSGTVLSVGCMYGGIWTAIIVNPIPAYVAFDLLLIALLLPVFTVGLFFPLGAFIIAVLFNLVLVWFLPALLGAHILTYISTLIVLAALSAVAIVAIYHRNRQEDVRLLALRQAKEAAEKALQQVKQLEGLLPICSYCKKIRADDDAWLQLEHYISEHSEAEFSHGVCPDCYAERLAPQLGKDSKEGSRPDGH